MFADFLSGEEIKMWKLCEA